MATWAFGVALLTAAPAVAAPPSNPASKLPSLDDGGLPPPPVEGDDAGTSDVPTELTEEEKEAQRRLEYQTHIDAGEVAAEKERYDEAVREYTAALRIEPGDPAALLGRAMARKARKGAGRCPTRAIRDMQEIEKQDPKGVWQDIRSDLIVWMSACGSRYATRQLRLARSVADDEPGTRGRDDDIRVTLAKLEFAYGSKRGTPDELSKRRTAALAVLEAYLEECKAQERKPQAEALKLMAGWLRDEEQLERSAELYEQLARGYSGSEFAHGAAKIREEIEFELELQQLDETQGFRPSAAAQASYDAGVVALRGGDYETAERRLTDAIEESPWFPQAYYSRGVARARLDKLMPAVEDIGRSIRMDRSDYRAHMTLGLIYKKEFAGAEDAEAIKHLSAALRLRPDLIRLHLLLGELYARTDREQAREHYQRFIQLAEFDEPEARTARQALEELEREIRQEDPLPMPPPAEESLRFLPPEVQRVINEAYLRGTEHEDWLMAEKILVEALDHFPSQPVILNELARVVYHQERFGDARSYWEQSLDMLEDQVEVHERLGLLLRRDLPDEAVPHLRRAADLGSLTARYLLAELLWDLAQPLEAREQIERFLAEGSDYNLYWDRAQVLHEEIESRFFQAYLLLGVLLALMIAIPAWRVYRHYRGASLEQLLERAPKSYPEVARVLSLIRHEILKHNTAFLADVGKALEYEAPDADVRAEVLGKRLFGEAIARRGRPSASTLEGIYGRFHGYLDELEKVARQYQVTLNLHRKDTTFRPMIAAFDDLARWAPALRRTPQLSSSKRIELARCLRKSGHVLGRKAFERLSGLIRQLCVTNVDEALVRECYAQVSGEKQFAGVPLGPLQIEGAGAQVRIFRTDLEDILANVMRNSLRSSAQYAQPPVALGLTLLLEIDEITGLGSLAIRIKDRSPEKLSNEMLRGRYVERGMGITVDLLSRYDGAIGVESEPGWSKAVVLRFFTVEEDAPLPEPAP
ncbi:MAG: tetratricopeptide repeat protein [Myxococcota bacterium]